MKNNSTYTRKKGISKLIKKSWHVLNNSGEVFQLNEVAGFIWKTLKKPQTFDSLLEEIKNNYEVDNITAKNDLEEFLKKYKKEKLIMEENSK